MYIIQFIVVIVIIPVTMGARPGTFFWKPRLSLDLTIPTTESPHGATRTLHKEDIYRGYSVLVDGYAAGMTIMALAAGVSGAQTYPFIDIMEPAFWTNAYRWAIRYISLLPLWAGGSGGHFTETLRTWKRRFYYMDEFIPKNLRKILFFIKPEQWQQEHEEWRKFKKYSEHAYGKHLRYPTKHFQEFKSMETKESELNYDEVSSESLAPGGQ